MDCSQTGSSVHGISQARILEWVAIPFSRGIFPTQGSNLGHLHCRWILSHLSHQGSPSKELSKVPSKQGGLALGHFLGTFGVPQIASPCRGVAP